MKRLLLLTVIFLGGCAAGLAEAQSSTEPVSRNRD